jgi:hypothetical protein
LLIGSEEIAYSGKRTRRRASRRRAALPGAGHLQIRTPQAEKLLFHFAPPFTGV